MLNLIEWLQGYLSQGSNKLIVFLILIAISNVVDVLIGWINAKFNNRVQFSSSKAILGIARKMVLLIVCVLFIPFALLLPNVIGLGALYILYGLYLASEVNSILTHLRLSSDDKQTDLFMDFLRRATNSKGDSGNEIKRN